VTPSTVTRSVRPSLPLRARLDPCRCTTVRPARQPHQLPSSGQPRGATGAYRRHVSGSLCLPGSRKSSLPNTTAGSTGTRTPTRTSLSLVPQYSPRRTRKALVAVDALTGSAAHSRMSPALPSLTSRQSARMLTYQGQSDYPPPGTSHRKHSRFLVSTFQLGAHRGGVWGQEQRRPAQLHRRGDDRERALVRWSPMWPGPQGLHGRVLAA
jgi:hypothetical protein